MKRVVKKDCTVKLAKARWVGCAAVVMVCVAGGCRTTSVSRTPIEMPSEVVAYGCPQGVSVASNGLRAAVLTWVAPEVKAYRYRIERALAPEGPFVWVADVRPSAASYTDGALPSARLEDRTVYWYRLTAILGRKGPASRPSEAVMTETAPPPAPPSNVKAEATGSRAVTVSWEVSPSDAVTAYRVERAAAAVPTEFQKVAEVAASPAVDGGTPASTLKDSADYVYRVVALNRVGSESVPSGAASVKTFPPPKPVQKLAAVSREVRCVPLTWEKSLDEDVIYYTVYQARDDQGPYERVGTVQGRETTQFTDGGGNPGSLEDEGTYFYRVRAMNAVLSESDDSATVRAVTREVPPAINQVVVVSAKPREVPVSWDTSQDTAVVGYEVWRATGAEEDWTQVARVSGRETTSFLDRGGEQDPARLGRLKDGTEYQYRVVAFNTANVRSSASSPVTAKTKLVPIRPAGVTATTNLAHSVTLTWLPNPEKDVNGYVIESSRKARGGFRKLTELRVVEGAPLTVDESELQPSTVRYYRVRALDREGLQGEWSEPVMGRSKSVPDAPSGLQAEPLGTGVRIMWQPPQGNIVHYNVWEKRLFGWRLLATTSRTEYRLEREDDQKLPVLAVTAVDGDKLESKRSEALKP